MVEVVRDLCPGDRFFDIDELGAIIGFAIIGDNRVRGNIESEKGGRYEPLLFEGLWVAFGSVARFGASHNPRGMLSI